MAGGAGRIGSGNVSLASVVIYPKAGKGRGDDNVAQIQ
jgi:hypothetical protein